MRGNGPFERDGDNPVEVIVPPHGDVDDILRSQEVISLVLGLKIRGRSPKKSETQYAQQEPIASWIQMVPLEERLRLSLRAIGIDLVLRSKFYVQGYKIRKE
jgi:hypothetical protein